MAEARIDLGRLRKNIEIVKSRVSPAKVLFPVKADGYGHGAIGVSRLAEEAGIDYLGVANLFEALELRDAGIKLPILILSASRPEHAAHLIEADLTVTVSTYELMKALDEAGAQVNKRAKAHVKVDTGMGRNGVLLQDTFKFMQDLDQCNNIEIEGVFSHYSVSYSETSEDIAYTQEQTQKFNALLDQLEDANLLPPICHIANSSGLVQFEDSVTTGHYNMVRPGVLIYGYPEVRREWTAGIKPPMSLHSWVVSVKQMPKGSYIGYGRKFQTERDLMIATIPIGYGDGINPRLSDNGEIVIHGQRAPFVGGLSMDQLTVDVSHISNVQVGDEVQFISDELEAEEIAQKMGARFTEVVLTALSRRVARVFVE